MCGGRENNSKTSLKCVKEKNFLYFVTKCAVLHLWPLTKDLGHHCATVKWMKCSGTQPLKRAPKSCNTKPVSLQN